MTTVRVLLANNFLFVQVSYVKSQTQLAKELRAKKTPVMTPEQASEAKNCFDLFDTDNSGKMRAKELKVAMRAVGFDLPKEDYKRILREHIDEGEEFVDYATYCQIMTKLYWALDRNEEIDKCFFMFDNGHADKITFKDLKRVAKELGENMTDEEISEMLEMTGSDPKKNREFQLTKEQFRKVMEETNLFPDN